jgi:hypothetical protein
MKPALCVRFAESGREMRAANPSATLRASVQTRRDIPTLVASRLVPVTLTASLICLTAFGARTAAGRPTDVAFEAPLMSFELARVLRFLFRLPAALLLRSFGRFFGSLLRLSTRLLVFDSPLPVTAHGLTL